jgi:hypothetical protein
MPVEAHDVCRHDLDVVQSALRNPHAALFGEPAILLDRHDPPHPRRQRPGQGPAPGSDFDDVILE